MADEQHTLELSRVLDASRGDLWKAWTDPEVLAQWWWPARFQTRYEVDLRVGGTFSFRSADLPDIGMLALTGTYQEISQPGRLVYGWQWENRDEPPTVVSVNFVERGAQTEVRIVHRGFPSPQERENHIVGWTDCLDRLHALLMPSAGAGD